MCFFQGNYPIVERSDLLNTLFEVSSGFQKSKNPPLWKNKSNKQGSLVPSKGFSRSVLGEFADVAICDGGPIEGDEIEW